jgi:hypothetical protein
VRLVLLWRLLSQAAKETPPHPKNNARRAAESMNGSASYGRWRNPHSFKRLRHVSNAAAEQPSGRPHVFSNMSAAMMLQRKIVPGL